MARKVGRPKRYSAEQIEEIKQKLSEYIDSHSIPIVAEFAYKNDIPRTTFYDYPEFSTLVKKLIDKKEAQLEIGTLSGKLNASMAIFSLKQIGWKDKQEIDLGSSSDAEPIKIKWN